MDARKFLPDWNFLHRELQKTRAILSCPRFSTHFRVWFVQNLGIMKHIDENFKVDKASDGYCFLKTLEDCGGSISLIMAVAIEASAGCNSIKESLGDYMEVGGYTETKRDKVIITEKGRRLLERAG